MPNYWGLLTILVIAFVLSTYVFQLAGLAFWAGFIAVILMIKGYSKKFGDSIPFPAASTAKVAGPVLLIGVFLMYGVFGLPTLGFTFESLFGGVTMGATILSAPITDAETQIAASACAAGISDEARDDAVSVTFNAYDVASAAGMGTAIDLTTSCWFYKDGNSPDDFVAASTDTSAQTESGYWAIGDLLYVYCGGTTYYTEPLEALCLDDKVEPAVLYSRAIVDATTGIDSSAFDEDGNAMTAAGNTTTADYDVTLGANQDKKVSIKWTSSVAKESYNFGGVITTVQNDIDSIKPLTGGFEAVLTPNYLKSTPVGDDNTGNNQTLTYDVYTLDQPVMLNQWQSVKFDFLIEAGATDPTATDNVWSTLDKAIVCSVDMTYTKGYDGFMHLDFHNHGEPGSETGVGYAELIHTPVGGYECVVFEGN